MKLQVIPQHAMRTGERKNAQYALFALRASRSWSSTQWIPCLRRPALSCMCCEENSPFLRNSNFTDSNATDIAIINTLKSNNFTIFH